MNKVIKSATTRTKRTFPIKRAGRGLQLLDQKIEARRIKALTKLYGSCPNFPIIEPLRATKKPFP